MWITDHHNKENRPKTGVSVTWRQKSQLRSCQHNGSRNQVIDGTIRWRILNKNFSVASPRKVYSRAFDEGSQRGFVYVRPFVQVSSWCQAKVRRGRNRVCKYLMPQKVSITQTRVKCNPFKMKRIKSDKAETSVSTLYIRHEEFPILVYWSSLEGGLQKVRKNRRTFWS